MKNSLFLYFTFCLVIYTTHNLHGQSYFNKTYPVGNLVPSGISFGYNTEGRQTKGLEGGNIITGNVHSINRGISVSRIDENGNIKWTTEIRGTSPNSYFFDCGIKTIETCQGFYTIGMSKNASQYFGLNIITLDPNGAFVKNSFITLNSWDIRPSDMILHTNGDLIITGVLYGSSTNKSFVIAFNPNTNAINWYNVIDGRVPSLYEGDMATSLIEGNGGFIYVTGRTTSFPAPPIPPTSPGVLTTYIAKITSNGIINDFRIYPPSQAIMPSEGKQIIRTPDGNLAVIVSMDTDLVAGIIKFNGGNITNFGLRRKFSASIGSSLLELYPRSIENDMNGGYIIGGSAYFNGIYRAFVMSVTANGISGANQFRIRFNDFYTGTVISSITNTESGSFVLGGNYSDNNNNPYVLRKIKTNGSGAIGAQCTQTDFTITSTNDFTVSANLTSQLSLLTASFIVSTNTNPSIASYPVLNTSTLCSTPDASQFGISSWYSNSVSDKHDNGNDITTDIHGNTYIVGDYNIESSFPCIANPNVTFTDGKSKMTYIAKFDSEGNLLWLNHSKNPQSAINNSVYGRGIRVDLFGNVIITGECKNLSGTSFTLDFLQTAKTCNNPNSSTFINSNQFITSTHAFVAKFNANGGFMYSYLSDPTTYEMGSYAMDMKSNLNCFLGICNAVVICGKTKEISSGNKGMFVQRFHDNGSAFNSAWIKISSQAPATSLVYGSDIVMDGTNLQVVGISENGITLDGITLSHSGRDAFLFDMNAFTGTMNLGKIFDVTNQVLTVAVEHNKSTGKKLIAGSFIGNTTNIFGTTLPNISGSPTRIASFVMEANAVSYAGNWIKSLNVSNTPGSFTGDAIITDVISDDCNTFVYGSFAGNSNDNLLLNNTTVIGTYVGNYTTDEGRLFVSNLNNTNNGNHIWSKVSNHSSILNSKHLSSRISFNGEYLVYTGKYYGDIKYVTPYSSQVITGSNYNPTISTNTFVLRSLKANGFQGDYRNTFLEEENETFIEKDFNLYPNPSSGFITIQLNKPDGNIEQACTIQLYDLFGKLLFEKAHSTNSIEMDLSRYEKGLYFITINVNGFIKSKRVVLN